MILTNIYNQPLTIFNKLRESDSANKRDVWYKTEISNAVWYKESVISAAENSANIANFKKILIPFNSKYVNYNTWKLSEELSSFFTMSVGDYIVKGTVSETVDTSNIVKIMRKYGEDVCFVKSVIELPNRFGAQVQLKIEGV